MACSLSDLKLLQVANHWGLRRMDAEEGMVNGLPPLPALVDYMDKSLTGVGKKSMDKSLTRVGKKR